MHYNKDCRQATCQCSLLSLSSVGSEDPQLRDSWETLSSEDIWNLEQEEVLAQFYQRMTEELAIQDMEERWEPEWETDYNYPE